MKIINIFVLVEESLLAVQYDEKESDELSYLMNCWTDVDYLKSFFSENKRFLTSGFSGNITINEAIQFTLEEAERLETAILEKAVQGKTDSANTLQTLFKPLNNNEYAIPLHQKSKLKGNRRKSWLRIYAIRIGSNIFVISGGAIKLTQLMEESEHLKLELQKLEITKNYLKDLGVLDEDDYELLEI